MDFTLCTMVLLARRLKKRRIQRKVLENRKHRIIGRIPRSPSVKRGPFFLDDREFYRKFRLSKEIAHQIIVDVAPYIPITKQYERFSAETKILLTLKLFACGNMTEALRNEDISGSILNESKRCLYNSLMSLITAVTDTILERLASKWIHFPSEDDLESNRMKFLEKFGMAGVVGAIDGMHVFLKRPAENPDLYQISNQIHTINVQLICDADENIINVEPSNPGSYDESYIWLNSKIRHDIYNKYQVKEFGYWLVGDDSYPLEPFLMTPFFDGVQLTGRQTLYNGLLTNAHNSIQKVKRQLRSRFKCLSYQPLYYQPALASKIVTACCILHNMCKSAGLSDVNVDLTLNDFSSDDIKDIKFDEVYQVAPSSSLTDKGHFVRDIIVQTLQDIPVRKSDSFQILETLLK